LSAKLDDRIDSFEQDIKVQINGTLTDELVTIKSNLPDEGAIEGDLSREFKKLQL
jgi:hypothetical protein